ncbi:MAG: hypothetical protein LUG94_05665 [Ruminococcus sp.]|nr:hypothetical protein [Ruminococcus sp.]
MADYSGLNIFEVENVNIVDYLQLRRDAFIYKMNQTKDGQEYLNKAWQLEQTKIDRKSMRKHFGVKEVKG